MRPFRLAICVLFAVAGCSLAQPQLAVHPDRAGYRPGETVVLDFDTRSAPPGASLELRIFRLAEQVFAQTLPARPGATASWTPPEGTGGYGVDVALKAADGGILARATTAFDVQRSWTDMPRYGFLTDFGPGQADPAEIEILKNHHINALQFYDWMYRHDRHLPTATAFRDPLGRQLSLQTVIRRIRQAHGAGMAAMPYTTLYAGSPDYFRRHPEQALYHPAGPALDFGNGFLYLFDPSAGSGWRRHILSEYREILGVLPFDGLHIDQYGSPTHARDAAGNVVDLAEVIPGFLQDAWDAAGAGKTVLFNLVNNWPVEAVAPHERAASYIEVWPPHDDYGSIRDLIAGARKLSGGRPVILAAYLSPELDTATRLLDAVIAASGGTHIELGEDGALLADPYFPKYRHPGVELSAWLQRYYDFIVRYQRYLYEVRPARIEDGAALEDVAVELGSFPHRAVWLLAARGQGFETLHLINLTAARLPLWRLPQEAPEALRARQLSYPLERPVARVFAASPDQGDLALAPLDFQQRKGVIYLTVPRLETWTMLVFEYE